MRGGVGVHTSSDENRVVAMLVIPYLFHSQVLSMAE
jgi:hypothetical protein